MRYLQCGYVIGIFILDIAQIIDENHYCDICEQITCNLLNVM